jgi:outer membrane immunogenic protein
MGKEDARSALPFLRYGGVLSFRHCLCPEALGASDGTAEVTRASAVSPIDLTTEAKGLLMVLLRAMFLGVAASCALAQAAAAADLGGAPRGRVTREPVFEQAPFTWTGFYVGTHLGYGWSDIDWQETPAFDGTHDGSGWLAGGQIGYNWQAGRFVYGVEADLSSSWIDGGNNCCGHDINWLASVRGRAGITGFDNRTLFYVTAGAAWADVDYSSVGSFSETHFGWVAGGGVERAFTPNISARIEYLYYGFDSATAPAGTVGPPGSTADLDPSAHTVRFGLNFKF